MSCSPEFGGLRLSSERSQRKWDSARRSAPRKGSGALVGATRSGRPGAGLRPVKGEAREAMSKQPWRVSGHNRDRYTPDFVEYLSIDEDELYHEDPEDWAREHFDADYCSVERVSECDPEWKEFGPYVVKEMSKPVAGVRTRKEHKARIEQVCLDYGISRKQLTEKVGLGVDELFKLFEAACLEHTAARKRRDAALDTARKKP